MLEGELAPNHDHITCMPISNEVRNSNREQITVEVGHELVWK